MKSLYCFIIIVFISSSIFPQGFSRTLPSNFDLDKQFNSILSKSNEDIFIGYSITTNTDELVSIGSLFIDDNNYGFSLRQIIDNPEKYNLNFTKNGGKNRAHLKDRVFRIIIGGRKTDIKPDPETAIIFHYSKGEHNSYNFDDIIVCNLALNIELAPNKMYWLGNIGNNNSLNYLVAAYKKASTNIKNNIIPAIGMHNKQLQTTQFLIDVANDKQNPKTRKKSLYWLGYQNNLVSLKALKKILHSNESQKLKREAIMGIAQMNIAEGLNELINVAKRFKEFDLRKEAIMWLGEKAIKKATDELKGFIENDPEIEIKKQALYSLAEQSEDNIAYIIDLAKNHQSLTIRKNAIYILGESNDKRAVDVLVELASGN
ncbi:MAG: HEAT repeat domain-containing protein [Bacteroidetes bacterium]|nr:HEAT repeat domain-containing protein [Bacteroidota bacterium]